MNKFQIIVCDAPWNFSDSLSMSKTPRGASANYKTLTQQDLLNLPVKNFIDPDGCVLASWSVGSLLQEGLDLVNAFGFTQKQVYVWVKTKQNLFEDEYKELKNAIIKNIEFFITNPFSKKLLDKQIKESAIALAGRLTILNLSKSLAFYMGRLFRQTHEICLIGTAGKSVYSKLENKSQRSVSFAINLDHSAKPEYLQDSLELMFPKSDGKLELFARRQRKGWICIGNEAPMTFGEDINESLNKLSQLAKKEFVDLKYLACNYVQEQELQDFWKGLK